MTESEHFSLPASQKVLFSIKSNLIKDPIHINYF